MAGVVAVTANVLLFAVVGLVYAVLNSGNKIAVVAVIYAVVFTFLTALGVWAFGTSPTDPEVAAFLFAFLLYGLLFFGVLRLNRRVR